MLIEALIASDRLRAESLLDQALKDMAPLSVIDDLIVPVLEEMGNAWQAGHLSLSQIYIAGRVCETVIARALPNIGQPPTSGPRIAIAVLTDFHMLGKRIVCSTLRASGRGVLDYGRVTVQDLINRVAADRVDILLISTLMLPAALRVREVRDQLDAKNAKVRIAVGGAPFRFDPQLWQQVGADAMGLTASDAIQIVQRWSEDAS